MEASLIKLAASPSRIGGFVARAIRFNRNQRILKRLQQGEKHAVVADEFDLSHNMITHIATKFGLPKRRGPSTEKGTTHVRSPEINR